MLIKFSVANFLSFKNKCTLSLEADKRDISLSDSLFSSQDNSLLKTAVVYGANASGKSNLIRAIMVFREYVSRGNIQEINNSSMPNLPFLLSTETESKPSFFEVEILVGSKIYVYGFKISGQKIHEEWLYQYPNKKNLFKRDLVKVVSNPRYFKEGSAKVVQNPMNNVLFLSTLANLNKEISMIIVNEIKKIRTITAFDKKEQTLNYSFDKFTRDTEYRKKMENLFFQADFSIENIISEEKQLTQEEIEKGIPAQLRGTISDKGRIMGRSLITLHKKFNEKGQSAGNTSFNFFQESEGTQQMFALAGPIINSLEEANTLFIDELDSSLHPLICRYILTIFNSSKINKKNAQLVFTTHDVSLLNEELLRRDQIWFTQKTDKGESELFSLSSLGERATINFAKRYLEGRYGAVPYVKTLEDIK